MPRLFFDEPLSETLCKTLADIFPNSLHIRLLGRGGAADATVWDLAREHGCLVVSKDEDFHRLALLRGAPPKFVWIRLAIARPMTSCSYCGATTTTSFGSTSRTKQQSLSSGEYERRTTRQRLHPTAAASAWSSFVRTVNGRRG